MKIFGGSSDEIAYAAEETPDGGYVLVGAISTSDRQKDVLVVKTDRNGNKVWSQTFGGLKDDEGRDIKVLADGGLLILGYTTQENDSTDFFLIKTDASGNNPARFTYGTSNKDEKGVYLKLTADGNYLLGGTIINADNTQDMFFVKAGFNGIIWQRAYGLIGELDDISAIEETDNNEIVWCGTVKRGGDAGSTDLRVVRADQYGNLIWDYAYGFGNGKNDVGYDLKTLNDGYIVIGTTFDTQDGGSDIFLVKLTKSGGVSWEEKIGGQGNQTGTSVDVTASGYVITGSKEVTSENSDIYLVSTNNEGKVAWENTFGGNYKDSGSFVKQTKDKGFLILGTTTIVNNQIINLIKTDEEGLLRIKQ